MSANMSNQDNNIRANNHSPHPHHLIPSEEELDLLFDQQANRAWTQYEHLKDKLENINQSSDNQDERAVKADSQPSKPLAPKALDKLKEFWQDNKDHLVS